jgi:hypothetical protein
MRGLEMNPSSRTMSPRWTAQFAKRRFVYLLPHIAVYVPSCPELASSKLPAWLYIDAWFASGFRCVVWIRSAFDYMALIEKRRVVCFWVQFNFRILGQHLGIISEGFLGSFHNVIAPIDVAIWLILLYAGEYMLWPASSRSILVSPVCLVLCDATIL